MAELPEGITQKELDRYAKIDAGIKKLSVEKAALNDKIKKAFLKAGTFIFGNVIIKKGAQMRKDAAAMEAAFPYKSHPQYWHMQFDPSLVDAVAAKKFLKPIETLSVSVADTSAE